MNFPLCKTRGLLWRENYVSPLLCATDHIFKERQLLILILENAFYKCTVESFERPGLTHRHLSMALIIFHCAKVVVSFQHATHIFIIIMTLGFAQKTSEIPQNVPLTVISATGQWLLLLCNGA